MKRLILTLAFCLTATTAHAFSAIVYSVHDGDTASMYAGSTKVTCRLGGIDAPEERWNGRWAAQPYADEAHEALMNMILGQTVDVEETGQHSYKRTVCRITADIDGHKVDVQREMVAMGFAWAATQFEPAKNRDPVLGMLELVARQQRKGLWADRNPVPPWEWRKH